MKNLLSKIVLKSGRVGHKTRQVKSQFHKSKEIGFGKGRLMRRNSEHQSPLWKSVNLKFSRKMSELKHRVKAISEKRIWIGEKGRKSKLGESRLRRETM